MDLVPMVVLSGFPTYASTVFALQSIYQVSLTHVRDHEGRSPNKQEQPMFFAIYFSTTNYILYYPIRQVLGRIDRSRFRGECSA